MSQKTKPYELFIRATEKLQLNAADLSEALGYSRSASNVWKKSGVMPKVASIACEGLVRRAGIKNSESAVYIAEVNSKKVDAFVSFCNALSITTTQINVKE